MDVGHSGGGAFWRWGTLEVGHFATYEQWRYWHVQIRTSEGGELRSLGTVKVGTVQSGNSGCGALCGFKNS